jgi:hypothetical protein
MKNLFLFSILILSAISLHGQNMSYGDTLSTDLGNFILETDEGPITQENTSSLESITTDDGGTSQLLSVFPSSERYANAINQDKVASFNVAPNPVSDFAMLSFQNGSQFLNIQITDISGRCLLSQKKYSENGNYEIRIDMSGYSNGVYFLVIENGDQRVTTKLVKN